jgi:UDP-glucose 6-dehydrogenase
MTTVANMKSYIELRQGVRKTRYKIVVVGLGYVGLSNAVLLAQNNTVIGIDLSQERVDMLNSGRSPVVDRELSEFLSTKNWIFMQIRT